jgi:hypothetical protein
LGAAGRFGSDVVGYSAPSGGLVGGVAVTVRPASRTGGVMARRHPGRDSRAAGSPRSWWAAGLTGVGLAGLVDVIVFHQLLGWHHFDDRSTVAVGLTSDGLLDLVLAVALVVGLVAVEEAAGPVARWGRRTWGRSWLALAGSTWSTGWSTRSCWGCIRSARAWPTSCPMTWSGSGFRC